MGYGKTIHPNAPLTPEGRRRMVACALDDGDTGVCNHSGSQTVYSFILWLRGDTTRLLVKQGHPCDSIEHAELMVPIGSDWSVSAAQTFRAAYPSAAAAVVV